MPHMLQSKLIILMGVLYNVDDDVFYPVNVHYHVNYNFIRMLNF